MDLFKIIDQLYREKQKLDHVILALEAIARSGMESSAAPGSPGRTRAGARRGLPAAGRSHTKSQPLAADLPAASDPRGHQ